MAMTSRGDIHEHLNAVLRRDLTAVDQYFIHILVLRSWHDGETARGIAAVNNADVANAMRVLDPIIATGGRPELRAASFLVAGAA